MLGDIRIEMMEMMEMSVLFSLSHLISDNNPPTPHQPRPAHQDGSRDTMM